VAEQEVAQAWLTLQRARAEHARVAASPEERELRDAERELSNAQSQAVRTRLDLQRLNGPDPAQLAEATRAVQRAEATLQAAQSARPTREPTSLVSERDVTVASAALALQQATARRDQIVAGPTPEEVEAARQADASAQDALRAATDRVVVTRERLLQVAPEATSVAMTAAQESLHDAESRLQAARQRHGSTTSR
jgi:hypothetical protein